MTCPPGVGAGQPLQVKSVDGTRTITTIVPPGISEGQTFAVEFPSLNPAPVVGESERGVVGENKEKSLSDTLDKWLTPQPENRDASPEGTAVETKDVVAPEETPKDREQPEVEKSPSLIEQLESFLLPSNTNDAKTDGEKVEAAEKEVDVTETDKVQDEAEDQEESVAIDTPEQKYLKVRIPRGMPVGSIMQVEIPGENRALAVTVPADASSFHVAYTPVPKRMMSPCPEMVRAPVTMPKAAAPLTVTPSPVPPTQKLLLVRVPPGTEPGTTLHVSVPDEPGRILAAQVPPGNVPEFHVAYESRAVAPVQTGMLPPANAYQAAAPEETTEQPETEPQQPHPKNTFAPVDPSDESFGGYDF